MKNPKFSSLSLIAIILTIFLLSRQSAIRKNLSQEFEEWEKKLPSVTYSETSEEFSAPETDSITENFPLMLSTPFPDIQYIVNDTESKLKAVLDSQNERRLTIISAPVTLAGKQGMKDYENLLKYPVLSSIIDSSEISKLDTKTRSFRAGFLPSTAGYIHLKDGKFRQASKITVNGHKGLMFLSAAGDLKLYQILLWKNPSDISYFVVQIFTTLADESPELKKLISSIHFR